MFTLRAITVSVKDLGAPHLRLEAADHDRSTARTGGTEWFLTSLKFLDQVAGLLKVPIEAILDDGDTE